MSSDVTFPVAKKLAALALLAAFPAIAAESVPDNRLTTDPNIPVTIDNAYTPGVGDIGLKLRGSYERLRRSSLGTDEAERSRRHVFVPEAEFELGVLPGVSFSVIVAYQMGNADGSESGDVDLFGKWTFLESNDVLPALALSASVAPPFGYANGGTVETTLGFFATKPLDLGGYVPYLHANFFVTHASNRDSDTRANRFTGVLGLALPILASTAVVLDLVHGQQEEKGRIENLAEIGIRQLLPGDMAMGLGVGKGFGGSPTDLRVLLGMQKSF
jgi:hypothetical protein